MNNHLNRNYHETRKSYIRLRVFLGSTIPVRTCQRRVVRSTVGYIGGHKEHPAYEEVKAHTTGHAEATLVEFDAEQTSFTDLCKLFFEIHDPAQTDGQGPDIGPQYRSEIFYLNEKQKQEAEAVIALLRKKGYVVNTKLTPASTFWEAEEYHQHYYDKTGGEPYCHIRTKKF